MNNRSFSSRLSWRIIVIVTVVFLISFALVGWEMQYLVSNAEKSISQWVLLCNLLVLGIIGLVVLYFVCRRVIRRMTRPVTELSVSAMNMAKGNFKAKLPQIDSNDEMRRLHDSFLYMQNSITDYISQLKETKRDKERMESELNVARAIQMGMLSTDFPSRIHALLNPAREVGGDLYDFMRRGDNLHFAIGDVSGKGVPASIMMAITRATLHFMASLDLPLNETIGRINNSVADGNSRNMFVTLFIARIDLKTRRMNYCNAGHNPLVIVPPDGKPRFLDSKSNIAVGLIEDFSYEAQSIVLEPGTRIIAYTDGVTEAENAALEQYGEERLLEEAGKIHAEMDNKAAVDQIYRSVLAFTKGNAQNDDITILSIMV